MTILKLENEHLHATFADDASATILDKATGKRWQMTATTWQDVGPLSSEEVWCRGERYWADYYQTRFKVQPEGDALRVRLYGPPWTEDAIRGSFRVRWSLDGRSLGLEIEAIDECLPSLNFPPSIVSESLLVPNGVGKWLREVNDGMNAYFWTQNSGLNQRWIGGLDADDRAGWMAIFENGYEDSGVYRTSLKVMPSWLKSHGKWAPSRSLRYHFVSGGYVSMAKTLRRYLRERNLFRTLDEKIAATPALKNLVGGRIISTMQCWTEHPDNAEIFLNPPSGGHEKLQVAVTHADMAEAIRLAKSWGMGKGLFMLRGTWQGGYDERHPDVWPPEPALGSIDALKELFDHQNGTYLTALHDNAQDIYLRSPSFPQNVLRTKSGHLMHGGVWHGGQCFITCPACQRAVAERNWKSIQTLGMSAHFVDTATCVQFYECYDPAHPTTRSEDRKAKLNLMNFYKEQGIILGSEESSDFGLYHIDWLENRHKHIPGVTPPLWALSFHDAAIYARYSTDGTSGGNPATDLPNWLWGYASYWPVNTLADWRGREAAFKASLPLDAFHARIATSEMTDHRFYGEDRLVERSEFSCGVAVYANFSNEPRTVDGVSIAAQDKTVVG
ncbi:MAG: glycoside hydrolase [Verrucomicrobiota bacterium]|nr:glycoside hydrolase [Verrucomicrobiota bacterium]